MGGRTAGLVEQRLSELVIRGGRDGAFRDDVPVRWVLTVHFAQVHAAGREVAKGASTVSSGERYLLTTLLRSHANTRDAVSRDRLTIF